LGLALLRPAHVSSRLLSFKPFSGARFL